MTRTATTKIRCPRCRSADIVLVEEGRWTSSFIIVGGVLDRSEGHHEPTSIDRVFGNCSKCGHHWRLRNAVQITDVVEEVTP